MNPQQFNMGMGRGVPNNMQQMNPAFAMNNQMTAQMGGQQPMPMQPGMAAGNNANLQKVILMGLHSQGQFGGWQAGVGIQERAVQVRQLVDSLRLVRPPVEVQRALEVALQFERKAFQQRESKELYLRECNDKLARIRDQRTQQMQQGINIPGQQNMNMQQMGQNMNQNMPINMGQMQNPNIQQNMGLPQHMTPQQQQQPSPAFNQQGQQNMQNQNKIMQEQNQANQQKAVELTPEDNKAINQRAAEMASSTPKEEMKNIVNKMSHQFCESLRAKGVEPIIYYFRMLATKEFRNRKSAPEGSLPNQMGNNGMMANPQGQSFSDMGRFQGLQADGLRSQEGGEMVVPASNNQAGVPGMMQRGTQMVNPNYAEQQRRLQLQQQASNMQRAAALRGQQQAQAQAQAQAGMAQQGQNTPQTNTPMQMLNRPVGQNVQQGVSPQTGSRPPSRTPMPQQMPGQMNMQEVQKREQFLAQWPVNIQNVLRSKPHTEWHAIIQQIRATNNNMQRSTSQNPQAMGRPQQLQSGAFVGGTNIGTPMLQSLSAGAAGPQQNEQTQLQMNQEMIRQRQAMQTQQQQQQMQANQQAGKPPQQGQQARQLTPQEMKFMDAQQVPPNILHNFRQHVPVPNVKNWNELKQWAMSNPIPVAPMPQLIKVQQNHFAFLAKNRAQQNAVNQGQQQQSHPMPQQQAQNIPQQQRPMGNPPQIKVPTQQDIQIIKAQNPQLQNATDDQVRHLWVGRQRLQLQKMMQQQAAQRSGMMPPGPNNQQPQPTPQTQQQQQRPPSAQNQQPRKPPVQQPKPPQSATEPIKNEPTLPKPAQPGPQRLPQIPNDKLMQMDPENRQKYLVAFRRQERGRKVSELSKQVQGAVSQLRPLKLDLNTRRQMQAKLTGDHVKQMMGRFDQFLFAYPDLDDNEADLRKFVQYKLELFAQYQPPSVQSKTWIPLDAFSIAPDRLEMMLNELSAKFTQMHQNLSKNTQQLTPENLSRLEQQEQERKKSKGSNSNSVPPAPTTDRPPFQFGDARGHGAPKYASPGVGIKQEDLKLPADAKRRKKNPPATPTNNATPVSATPPAPSPQAVKQQQPPQQQLPAAMFRCSVPNCERQAKGFSTQLELEQHTNTTHKIDMNPPTDPITFLDGTLRDVFNLDENYDPIVKPKPKSAPMEKSVSKASLPPNFKVESKPGTSAASAKPRNQIEAISYELPKDENGEVLEEWKGVNIDLNEWNKIFGEWEWEDVVPAAALKLQDDSIANYQKSEEWQNMLRTPSLAETSTEKSNSPPVADNEEPKAKPEHDDTYVDLSAIDGLDLTGMDELSGPQTTASTDDIAMSDDGASPFEMIDKPEVSSEQQFLLDNGIDYTQPQSLTVEQKKLMDFIMEPPGPVQPDRGYNFDIDWEAVEKQHEEDVKNQVPGTWTPNGFIPKPRK